MFSFVQLFMSTNRTSATSNCTCYFASGTDKVDNQWCLQQSYGWYIQFCVCYLSIKYLCESHILLSEALVHTSMFLSLMVISRNGVMVYDTQDLTLMGNGTITQEFSLKHAKYVAQLVTTIKCW